MQDARTSWVSFATFAPICQSAPILDRVTVVPTLSIWPVCGLRSAVGWSAERKTTQHAGDLKAQAVVDENQDQVPESSLQVRKWSVLGLSLGSIFSQTGVQFGRLVRVILAWTITTYGVARRC
ncbi:uncharacterized protein APUU_11914S [Aspergillus puulaauensis]|uniref:Uncharacterized protein n=1 Tax=Aspergillus puulaauensis TaxID=1220207 RepID=A0A7R7XD59_9EURO|nr:uncharacterized protein APUU_11914S [Aspergillus puulaauensis]BCS19086.1 hypothetical protein APUU_11914S [Aspergillus puulaauensis]